MPVTMGEALEVPLKKLVYHSFRLVFILTVYIAVTCGGYAITPSLRVYTGAEIGEAEP